MIKELRKLDFKRAQANATSIDRLLAYCTVEEARDELISWAERGIPQGTPFETTFAIIIKSVAWLCVKQMERDRKENLRYGR